MTPYTAETGWAFDDRLRVLGSWAATHHVEAARRTTPGDVRHDVP
jgi:hypothetical protein